MWNESFELARFADDGGREPPEVKAPRLTEEFELDRLADDGGPAYD